MVADASLIAAAPEMIGALVDALPLLDVSIKHPFNLYRHDECGDMCLVIRMRAIIIKALGQ